MKQEATHQRHQHINNYYKKCCYILFFCTQDSTKQHLYKCPPFIWVQHSLTWTKRTRHWLAAVNSGNHHKAHKPSSLTWARENDKLQHQLPLDQKLETDKTITNLTIKIFNKMYWTKNIFKRMQHLHIPSTSLKNNFSQLHISKNCCQKTMSIYVDIFISWVHRLSVAPYNGVRSEETAGHSKHTVPEICAQAMTPGAWRFVDRWVRRICWVDAYRIFPEIYIHRFTLEVASTKIQKVHEVVKNWLIYILYTCHCVFVMIKPLDKSNFTGLWGSKPSSLSVVLIMNPSRRHPNILKALQKKQPTPWDSLKVTLAVIKTPVMFHCTGCLIGIFFTVYFTFFPTNQGFDHLLTCRKYHSTCPQISIYVYLSDYPSLTLSC